MRFSLILLAGILAAHVSPAATQSVLLKPGWNAVWLEVAPADPSPAAVFNGLPVEQVWCYFPKDRPVEFIDDPESGLWNKDAWSVFIPSGPEAFLSNLHAIQAHRAYLIKLAGNSGATLTLEGQAGHRAFQWKPKSFNLVGFPVDPSVGASGAGAFFFSEPALRDGAKYKLTSAGQWVLMSASDAIRNGEAYWIYADAATDFGGPLQITGSTDFGPARERAKLEIKNTNTWHVTVNFNISGNFPLVSKTYDENGNVIWEPFGASNTVIPPGETLELDLGVQRKGADAAKEEELTITGGGTRIKLPLQVEKPAAAELGGGYAGLWVGNVTLNQVAEVNSETPATAKPTPSEMSFRVILHVDAAGQVKLLKSVTTLWKDGLSASPGLPAAPGQYVLVTDDARIPDFKGATLRDGRPFGYRISSIAYDHPGHQHAVAGTFGASLSTQLKVERDSPTHPYRHQFHPDHDGLDEYRVLSQEDLEKITADQEETWEIVRAWQFTFQPEANDHSPASGYNRASGVFQETLSGMHKAAILMKGTFELHRVAPIPELNPSL